MLSIEYYRPYIPTTNCGIVEASWRFIMHKGCTGQDHWSAWLRDSYLPNLQRAQRDALILAQLRRGVFMARKHYDLWNWLAETGNEHKSNWPGFGYSYDHPLFYKSYPETGCYACETAKQMYFDTKRPTTCARCPIAWGTRFGTCTELYNRWKYADNTEARKKAARVIAAKQVRDDFPGMLIY